MRNMVRRGRKVIQVKIVSPAESDVEKSRVLERD